jgi:2'-5' RNA ligase
MAWETTTVTYWLCPAEPARTHLATLIQTLAEEFEAPVFEPHVTVYITNSRGEDPNIVLDQALKERGPYRLSVRAIDYGDKFTNTLFVQFEPDRELSRLSKSLRRAFRTEFNYELNPHLSLMYKTMSAEHKLKLARSIALPFPEVEFDSAKAVISPARISSREDVEAWRVIAERRLTG